MKAVAFTLVEMLVVVVILLALIAIALPVANMVRSRSLVSACASNLSQIGKAVLMYADDHQGWLPCHSLQSWKGPGDRGRTETKLVGRPKEWRNSLKPYTKSHEVFWCPADRYRGKSFLAQLDWPEDNRQLYTSYRLSIQMLFPWYRGPNGTLAIRLQKLKHGPSNTYYLVDWLSWPPANFDFSPSPHGRGSNGLLLDGSVKWDPEAGVTVRQN